MCVATGRLWTATQQATCLRIQVESRHVRCHKHNNSNHAGLLLPLSSPAVEVVGPQPPGIGGRQQAPLRCIERHGRQPLAAMFATALARSRG